MGAVSFLTHMGTSARPSKRIVRTPESGTDSVGTQSPLIGANRLGVDTCEPSST